MIGRPIAVRMMRVVREGCRITHKNKATSVPPDIPENPRAQYFHRPERKVVAIADKIQTDKKDLGVRAEEVETAGMSSARKVEKWTKR